MFLISDGWKASLISEHFGDFPIRVRMGSVDPVRKTAPKSQHPWRLFKGDDLTHPVEMFIHIMEFKNAQNPNGIGPDYENTGGENGVDPSAKLIKCVLGHIPDPKYSDAPDGDPPPSMNTPGLVINSILFCWLFKIKDRCKKVRFQQTHNQGLCQLLLTVSWDLRA